MRLLVSITFKQLSLKSSKFNISWAFKRPKMCVFLNQKYTPTSVFYHHQVVFFVFVLDYRIYSNICTVLLSIEILSFTSHRMFFSARTGRYLSGPPFLCVIFISTL